MGKRKVGRRGLPVNEVRQLERLIVAGQDRQTILQQSGVGTNTLRKAERHALPAQRPNPAYARCETCGVRVKIPCVACHVKRMQQLWSIAEDFRAKKRRRRKKKVRA